MRTYLLGSVNFVRFSELFTDPYPFLAYLATRRLSDYSPDTRGGDQEAERERLKGEFETVREEKQRAREHELKLCELELKLKKFCPKENTVPRVNKTGSNDSEVEGLNGVRTKIALIGKLLKVKQMVNYI
ncbi:hypothetical protein CEXT_589361 [Caerostris extrusa]|uniref:Uncharacterized protein n=1 Tax=Caerostris extrusa TaxID=172846 RepID=A0AAV4QCL1_CAEEX|nr:hypothetical protein CEXT_589361 [Caerostris extrusa]